jgi:hypothetical protein
MMKLTAFALLSLAPAAMAVADICQDYSMDFSDQERGAYISDDFAAGFGLTLQCEAKDDGDDGRCRIFDTTVPYGEWVSGSGCDCSMENCSDDKKGDCGDSDLGAPNNQCPGGGPGISHGNSSGGPNSQYSNCEPRGNVLVIDENGEGKPPDDAQLGGKMRFLFEAAVQPDEICFLDVDGAEQTFVSVRTLHTIQSGVRL